MLQRPKNFVYKKRNTIKTGLTSSLSRERAPLMNFIISVFLCLLLNTAVICGSVVLLTQVVRGLRQVRSVVNRRDVTRRRKSASTSSSRFLETCSTIAVLITVLSVTISPKFMYQKVDSEHSWCLRRSPTLNEFVGDILNSQQNHYEHLKHSNTASKHISHRN